MKKIICTLLVLCTLLSVLSSCGTSTDEFQLVSDENEIFELYVPKTWVSNLSSGIASAYASFENKILVSAMSNDSFSGYTLGEFLNASLQSFETLDGYKLVSEASSAVLGGNAAYVLEYEALVTETVKFIPTSVSYKFKTVLAQNGAYFVTLTYCAPTENYDKAIDDFDRIISKFKFKDVEKVPSGLVIASGNEEIFRLYVPSDWIPNVSGGSSGAYSANNTKNIVDVKTLRQVKNYTLNEFTSVTIESFEKMTDYELILAPEKVEIDGKEANLIEYKATISESAGSKTTDVVYKFRVYVVKYEATFTIITLCAPESEFDKTSNDFDLIVEEFEFKSYEDGEIEKDDFMDTTTDAPEGYQLASSDKYEFRFYVPLSWTVQRRTYNPKAYYSATDVSNVTINSFKADQYVYDGKTYWEDYIANTSLDISDIITDENAKMGGYGAYSVEFVQKISGMTYKIKQVYLSVNSIIYVFTYTSTPANYDKHMEDVNKMIEMFELK